MKTRNKMTKAILGAGLALLLASALTSTATAQNRIVFRGNGKFGSGKSVSGLMTMNPNGSGLALLTKDSGSFAPADLDPAWSPGQTHIVFDRRTVSGKGNNQVYTDTIYVMEAKGEINGGRSFAVTQGYEPDWSPDGAMILFRTRDYDVAVVSVDVATGAVGTPIKVVATALHEYRPVWSPDGSKLAFARQFGSGTALYVHDLATGNEAQLATGSNLFDSAWSPDGTRIAFTASTGVYVVNTDGSNLSQLYNGSARFPTWSPDGAAIAFSSGGILKIDLATGVITTVSSSGSNPDWSP